MKRKNNLKVGIFIIAYQAAQTLISAYKRIPPILKRRAKEIYCFDDCSDDNTYYIGLGYKVANNIKNFSLYKNPKNLGYGGNQKKGYRYAIKKGYDIIVMLHGDAQYAPEKIPLLLKPYYRDKDKIGLVMGSRMMGNPLKEGMPLYKFIGNKVLTWLENLILGTNLSEFHSGYRAYNLHALKSVPFEKCSNDFHFDSEVIIMLLRAGYKIVEVTIPTYYGPGSKSSVNVFKYGINCLRAVIGFKLHLFGFLPNSKFNFPVDAKTRYTFKEGLDSSHMQIASKIKKLGCKNVLDLGCAGGFMANALGKSWKGNLIGIEYDETWNNATGLKHYKRVIWADLNKENLIKLLPNQQFDAIIAADVLEHLEKPDHIIFQATKLLAPHGYIITSLPNSNFLPVLLIRLIFPSLRMINGPLDYTHKHFYSLKTAKKLFKNFSLSELETQTTPLPLAKISRIFSSYNFFCLFQKFAVLLARIFPNYLSYQFILVHKRNTTIIPGEK